MKRLIICIVGALVLTSCDSYVANHPVPYKPVNLGIDTRAGIFVHFVPTNVCSHATVDATGYHYLTQTLPLTNLDYYGYAGVVIFITNNSTYAAFDLACPVCLSKLHPCTVDGIFATCPLCGEQYDLSFGYATPCKGISKYALKQYSTIYSNYRLTVRN